jgi:hypothetical protein
MTLQLVDRSVKVPQGIVEDVLIKVDKFYFPVDFIVLDTEPVQVIGTEIPVILGRPFLDMANTLINCRSGVMKISFGNMTMELNIFHIRKQPLDYDQMNQVCLIEEILDEVIEESIIEDPLEACLAQFGEDLDLDKLMEQAEALLETTPLESKEKKETPVPDPLKKELKPLPNSLKYKFLGPAESDGDQDTTSKDLVQVPIGPVTRVRAKKFKDVLNGLIQELWAQANSLRPIEHDPQRQQRVVTLLQVLEG